MPTTKFKTGIIQLDTSHHFPLFFVAGYHIRIEEQKNYIFRRDLSDVSVEIFKYKLCNEAASQTLLIKIMHMIYLLKILAHCMTSVPKKEN